jgi:hypothetical protein
VNITNPQLEASQGGDGRWTLLVTAFLEYTRKEVESDFEFERWATVFEADALGSDDLIIESAALRFRPPSIGHPAEWRFQNISRDLIDTELGDEEIYVQVSLRNFTTDSFPINARTPTVTISA